MVQHLTVLEGWAWSLKCQNLTAKKTLSDTYNCANIVGAQDYRIRFQQSFVPLFKTAIAWPLASHKGNLPPVIHILAICTLPLQGFQKLDECAIFIRWEFIQSTSCNDIVQPTKSSIPSTVLNVLLLVLELSNIGSQSRNFSNIETFERLCTVCKQNMKQ